MNLLLVRIEPFNGSAKRCRIVIEGACDICLYRSEVRRFGWQEGDEISSEVYDSIIRDILIPRAKQRAIHLLEQQDRTEAGLRNKLSWGGYPPVVIDEVISYLRLRHYIDDERYARTYVEYHKNSASRRKLRDNLTKKGVDKELSSRILEEIYDSDEKGMILELMRKRRYTKDEADDKARSSMFRYLISRGFQYDDFRDML